MKSKDKGNEKVELITYINEEETQAEVTEAKEDTASQTEE